VFDLKIKNKIKKMYSWRLLCFFGRMQRNVQLYGKASKNDKINRRTRWDASCS